MLVELETKFQMKKFSDDQIHAIIMLVENSKFGTDEKPYYEKICGAAMHSFLENACYGFKRTLAVLSENENFLDVAKTMLNECETTIILFSDTPLISKNTIISYLEKFMFSNENFLQLPKGFIFKTDYLKQAQSVAIGNQNFFEKNEFFEVKNLKDLESATRYLQNEILNFHLQRGVKIQDKQTTKIDVDVDIEKGAVILPFSQILGRTFVGKNSVISSSILKNCKIEENCEIENCNLENCKVLKNSKLKPFTFAKGKELKGEKTK